MKDLTIVRPDDFHVHLRQDGDLTMTVRETARVFGRALVMPNLKPAVLTAEDAIRYRAQIVREAAFQGFEGFTPIMTIQLVATTTPEIIRQAHEAGMTAAKYYPRGVTTNSENGVEELISLMPCLREMQRLDMVLCLHGERPGVFSLSRESQFLPVLRALGRELPKLRMVLEHLSTAAAVMTVADLPSNVGATITAHHLLLTLDDVVGDLLRPHHFCKPIAKFPEDREALIEAATGGDPKFFFGSDTAPHEKGRKECDHGCAGVFSAPVALPTLAEVFERRGALGRLEAFTSLYGAAFYGLPVNEGTVTLRKEAWTVPDRTDRRFVPFRAGETIEWKVVG